MIMNIMEIENSLVNTNHPDFVGSADSLLNLFKESNDEAQAPSDDKVYTLWGNA